MPALAQFRVEVTGVGLRQLPIAIAPFRGEAAALEPLIGVVSAPISVDAAGGALPAASPNTFHHDQEAPMQTQLTLTRHICALAVAAALLSMSAPSSAQTAAYGPDIADELGDKAVFAGRSAFKTWLG